MSKKKMAFGKEMFWKSAYILSRKKNYVLDLPSDVI